MSQRYYNRRERKQIQKAMGLQLPENATARAEMQARKMEAGRELFNQFKEQMINNQEKEAAEREARVIQSFMADTLDSKGNVIRKGMTYEEAKAIVIRNYEIERKRLQKKADKIAKQSDK